MTSAITLRALKGAGAALLVCIALSIFQAILGQEILVEPILIVTVAIGIAEGIRGWRAAKATPES